MTGSLRTEIAIETPWDCPIAEASAESGGTVSQVARSTGLTSNGTLTEEFSLDANDSVNRSDMEEVFHADSRRFYRFEREAQRGCVCEVIEQHGYPVSDIRADDGTLVVSVHLPDAEAVRNVVKDLHSRYDDIQVRRLNQSGGPTERDFVYVDREVLTSRQREVLESSLQMGYFDHPKRANAGEVASELGITTATYKEHLAVAQRKLLESILRT